MPMSLELRKVLWRYMPFHSGATLFATARGDKLDQRNVLREFKRLGKTLKIEGVRFSPHTLRHTFAVGYLRQGGNVFYLQRILGHTSLEMTNKYVRSLGVEDPKAVHERFSLLSATRYAGTKEKSGATRELQASIIQRLTGFYPAAWPISEVGRTTAANHHSRLPITAD